jgi:hypothetical protein
VGPPISLEETIAMANEDMSGEISEARRRALEASVAPGADIDLTYEEVQELWASVREGAASHPGVITMESDITSIVFQRGHFEGSVEITSSLVTVR